MKNFGHIRYLVEFENLCITYSLFLDIDSFLGSLFWLFKDSSIDHVKRKVSSTSAFHIWKFMENRVQNVLESQWKITCDVLYEPVLSD